MATIRTSAKAIILRVELFFRCKLRPEAVPRLVQEPDDWQRSATWMRPGQLDLCRIYPRSLVSYLLEPDRPRPPTYLGDVN